MFFSVFPKIFSVCNPWPIAAINHNCSFSDHKRSNSNNRCWLQCIIMVSIFLVARLIIPRLVFGGRSSCCWWQLVTAAHHTPASAAASPLAAAAIRGWEGSGAHVPVSSGAVSVSVSVLLMQSHRFCDPWSYLLLTYSRRRRQRYEGNKLQQTWCEPKTQWCQIRMYSVMWDMLKPSYASNEFDQFSEFRKNVFHHNINHWQIPDNSKVQSGWSRKQGQSRG